MWMGRIAKGCVREVSLAQVSCVLMYVYVAPPTPVGAWSMALRLRQRFEYYYYSLHVDLYTMSCLHVSAGSGSYIIMDMQRFLTRSTS